MKKGSILSIEWNILVPVIILSLLSLSTLFSINFAYFKNQLFYLIISIFVFVLFSNINHKSLQLYSLPIYIISIIIFLIVLTLGIESRGAVRWIDIMGFRIQFSEILKPFLFIAFSSYISNFRNLSIKSFFYSILFSLPVLFLVFIQPDLGNALIYFFVLMLVLLFAGFPFRFFGFGLFLSVLSMPFFWNFLHDYQKQRVMTFLNPHSDPLGASYNAIQAILAVGSGMFFGKGLGEGTQSGLRFLPERHTDFIFAALSEEFGFVGSSIIILSFIFLLFKIYSIMKRSDDNFSRIFAASAFFLILIQLFFNIGMNIGVLPVVGITLPFVSYGGSSILSNFILLGLLSSAAKTRKDKDVLEIK